MALADLMKALGSVEDATVHGVVGAFMTADAIAHQAFGKSPLYFDAARVQRIAATLQTYFGVEPLGTADKQEPERPQEQPGDTTKSDELAAAEKAAAGAGAGDAGAGAGGGPALATERPAGLVSTIEADAARVSRKALDIGEEGLHAIEEALGRTAEPAHPPAPSIARS